MAISIANGIFKQLSYAKEFELGKVQDMAGEGLASPATIAITTGVAQGNNLIIGTNLTVTGLLAVGQLFQIGSDKYKITAVTTNASGNTTVATIVSLVAGDAKALNNYVVGAKVTLLNSTEEFLISTAASPTIGVAPTSATTATATGSAGSATVTVGSFAAGVIPVGQRLTIGGHSYIVTASTSAGVATASLTVYPVLVTSPATAAITFVTAITPKYLRRVTSNLDLKKSTFKSNEIRSDQQRSDVSVGANTVDGTVNGELSNRTYSDFIQSVLRRDFTTGNTATSVAISAATAAKDTSRLTLTTSTDTTATLKVGDVVYSANWGNPATLDGFNNFNFIVIENTATKIVLDLLKDNFTANIALTGLTITPNLVVKGKKTFVPKTGHTKDSYSIEHWYSDIGESEVFTGCRPTQMALKLSPSAMATSDFTFMGTGMKVTQVQQLANPTASGTDSVISATTGALYIKNKKGTTGVLEKVGLLTSFDLTVNGNGTTASVVGSDTSPDIFVGAIDVTGNSSIYFIDAKYRDSFLNQDEVSIIAVFRADGDANGNFMSIVLPKVKFTGASKDDGEKGLVMTMPFSALLYSTALGTTNFEETTIQIQDSAL